MAGKKGLVLCVDDEPNILRSLQWLLQKDFQVEIANSAETGLALLEQHDFDVIISDQRMPGKMGAEFLSEAAVISPRSMRLMLTGYSDLQSTLRSVNLGEVFRFINKPWNNADLPKIVLEAVHISKVPTLESSSPDEIPAKSADVGDEDDLILVIDDNPDMADTIRSCVELPETVIYANCIASALSLFDQKNIGLVIADTQVGKTDTTRMLKGLKHYDPAVVTVVMTHNVDATEIIAMINQGQVFRFLPKSTTPEILGDAIKAALTKRAQLKKHPESLKRHAVLELPFEVKQSLLRDIDVARLKSTPSK